MSVRMFLASVIIMMVELKVDTILAELLHSTFSQVFLDDRVARVFYPLGDKLCMLSSVLFNFEKEQFRVPGQQLLVLSPPSASSTQRKEGNTTNTREWKIEAAIRNAK